MTENFFPIDRLQLFATDGQLYRAFDHLIAARMGTLLLVPFHLVVGRCDDVLDGCPVPWEEVFSVLEYPRQHIYTALIQDDLIEQLIHLGIDVADCELDTIAPMVNGPEKVLRMAHPCGVRYAVVMP
jgi:hypothetical protein